MTLYVALLNAIQHFVLLEHAIVLLGLSIVKIQIPYVRQ